MGRGGGGDFAKCFRDFWSWRGREGGSDVLELRLEVKL